MTALPLLTRSDAVLSDCGHYRYLLTRTWNDAAPAALFVMLNPSTADAARDDATIRRCRAFAEGWDCGGIRIVNLFAWRARKPRKLLGKADPVGPKNDPVIEAEAWKAAQDGGLVVCGWGAHEAIGERDRAVMNILHDARLGPLCLRETAAGFPAHPLYLPADLTLKPYRGRP